MLILTRKPGEAIRIGNDVLITVKAVNGRQVRLGIEAPNDIPVYREEIFEAMTQANRESLMPESVTQSVLEMFAKPAPKQDEANDSSQEGNR